MNLLLSDTTDTLDAGEKKKKAAHSREKAVRPLDWTALFDQNVDDDFKVKYMGRIQSLRNYHELMYTQNNKLY